MDLNFKEYFKGILSRDLHHSLTDLTAGQLFEYSTYNTVLCLLFGVKIVCSTNTIMPNYQRQPEGVCTDDLLLRKPGFLLSAMHSRTFRRFFASPLVFLFHGFLLLQLNQIWRIFCVM